MWKVKMAASIQDGVESPFFTQKSTGMPPIGQYFHFFMQFGVKLSKEFFKFNFFYEIKYGGQIVNFQRISKILFAKICFYLWSYIHAYFDFLKFEMAATNVFFYFCQKNRLLQKRVYACQCTLFLQSVKAQMLSKYHLYTICFYFWIFTKWRF
jgi:hypothetical protein